MKYGDAVTEALERLHDPFQGRMIQNDDFYLVRVAVKDIGNAARLFLQFGQIATRICESKQNDRTISATHREDSKTGICAVEFWCAGRIRLLSLCCHNTENSQPGSARGQCGR